MCRCYVRTLQRCTCKGSSCSGTHLWFALLASLDNYERAKVADALESVDFEDGEYIIRQGEEGHSFFILEQV